MTEGRWDIDYVEHARKSISKICIELKIAKLIAIKEKHPDAWDDLKLMIKLIDEV